MGHVLSELALESGGGVGEGSPAEGVPGQVNHHYFQSDSKRQERTSTACHAATVCKQREAETGDSDDREGGNRAGQVVHVDCKQACTCAHEWHCPGKHIPSRCVT